MSAPQVLTPAAADPVEPYWQAFVAACRDLNAAALDDGSAMRAIHQRVDAAEVGVRSTVATTPAGTAAPLWIVLHHMVTVKQVQALIVARDLDGLEAVDAPRRGIADVASFPDARPRFDPQLWLDALTTIGGGYALVSGRRLTFLVGEVDGEDLAPVMAQIVGQPDRQEAIKTAIERRRDAEPS